MKNALVNAEQPGGRGLAVMVLVLAVAALPTIWIIGASQGIGRELARALAQANHQLAVSARSSDKASAPSVRRRRAVACAPLRPARSTAPARLAPIGPSGVAAAPRKVASKGLSASGLLSPEGVQQALESLRRMKQIATGFQVRELRVIATCAVREATDGAAFVERVKQELDLDIEVISAEREAHLAFTSVARSFPAEAVASRTASASTPSSATASIRTATAASTRSSPSRDARARPASRACVPPRPPMPR